MKYFLLTLMLAAFSACTGAGTDPKVKCPTSQEQGDQTLTRAQWKACFGRQDKDASGGRG